MSRQTIAYVAYDGTRCEFTIPKGVNRALVARAIQKIHKGGDADLVTRGLTRAEVDLLLEVVATLQDHRIPAAV
jgi:hypothetical protein